ncbi:MAG: putative addiction module antidote protein [Tardiphaga sp.]|jgi:probable addiction module antidote protein|nr:putative addiction module antidote protein [Tardiphaga sp.]
MKISELEKWDAADYLKTPELQAEYLSIVMADGDATEIRAAINAVARARGMASVAKAARITREGLYRALGESGNPEFATVLKVLGALGMRIDVRVVAPSKPRTTRNKPRAA